MRKQTIYLLSFIIPIIIGCLLIYSLKFYPFSENSITSGDFIAQYMPLYARLKETILSFDLSEFYWSFSKGLGGAMPAVYGFNSLSPFTFLYVLVPIRYYNLVTVFVTILRYGVTSLAFSHYLMKRHHKYFYQHTSMLIVIFSIIYGLSGFIIAQQYNPNFLDNLVYLPLLAIGIEKILDGQKSIKFSIILAIMFITQFYTAYMASLFIIIYGIAYLIHQNSLLKEKINRYLMLGTYSFLGVMLSGFWLVPLLFNLFESKASAESIFALKFNILYEPILILSKFFTGSFHGEEWGDSSSRPQIFISAIGFIGLVHYFISNKITRKEKYSGLFLLIVFFLSFNISFFDQIWHMGQRPVGFYFRNSWIFIFIALTLGFQAFNRQYLITNKRLLIYLLCVGLLYVSVMNVELDYINATQIALTMVFNLIVIFGLYYLNKKQWFILGLMLLTTIDLFLNAYIGLPRALFFISNKSFDTITTLHENNTVHDIRDDKKFFRIEFYKGPIYANNNYFSRTNGLTHFTSSLEFKQIEVYSKLGLPSSTAMVNYTSNPFTDMIFNLQYYVDSTNFHSQTKDLLTRYEYVAPFNSDEAIYRNLYTLNLGFVVNRQFNEYLLENDNPFESQNELLKLILNTNDNLFEKVEFSDVNYENIEERNTTLFRVNESLPTKLTYTYENVDSNALYFLRMPSSGQYEFMLSKLFINGQNYQYQDRFKRDQIWPVSADDTNKIQFEVQNDKVNFYNLQGFSLYRFDLNKFKQLFTEINQQNLTLETVNNYYVRAVADVQRENSGVFFSIPFSSGWKARVDGKSIDLYSVWNVFIGLNIAKGKHEIELFYTPPGLFIGLMMTSLAVVILILSQIKWKKLTKI